MVLLTLQGQQQDARGTEPDPALQSETIHGQDSLVPASAVKKTNSPPRVNSKLPVTPDLCQILLLPYLLHALWPCTLILRAITLVCK